MRLYSRQELNLGTGCRSVGLAVHELGHALGMAHEHNRSDRTKFIHIDFNNMSRGWANQYAINYDAYTKIPYDYTSIMHYGSYSTCVNCTRPVMSPIGCGSKCPAMGDIGQRVGLSELDVDQVEYMYSCPVKNIWTNRQYCHDIIYKYRNDKKVDCKAYVRDGKCRNDPSPCCKCGSRGGWKLRVYDDAKSTTIEKTSDESESEEIELIIDEDDIEIEVVVKKKTEKSESESPMEIDMIIDDDDREEYESEEEEETCVDKDPVFCMINTLYCSKPCIKSDCPLTCKTCKPKYEEEGTTVQLTDFDEY